MKPPTFFVARFTRQGKAKKKVISAYLAHVQALNVAREYGSWIEPQTMEDLMSRSDAYAHLLCRWNRRLRFNSVEEIRRLIVREGKFNEQLWDQYCCDIQELIERTIVRIFLYCWHWFPKSVILRP